MKHARCCVGPEGIKHVPLIVRYVDTGLEFNRCGDSFRSRELRTVIIIMYAG